MEGTLQAITAAAVRTIPHADECGVTYVIGRSKVEPRAWTSELPRAVDALQERLEQGPCMDAAWEHEVVRVDHVATDERASHAAVALAGAQHETNLRTGMTNRDLIGQAKGILMERHRLTADQAFGVLARVSQEMNRKLIDIARELTDTGAVPERRDRRV